MNLSKTFDCLPHDLLIAKMEAYGFKNEDFFTFLDLYPKRQKQPVNINKVRIMFQILLSSVSQRSILGPL